MNRIHDSIRRVFQRHRLVFWYDATGEWAETFATFVDEQVQPLRVDGNEFGTKVRVVREPNPQAKFLLYIPSARPPDPENWLLDLLLQGYEYKADKASLALQEVGLPHAFKQIAEEHAAYFQHPPHIQALKESLKPEDEIRDVRLKMMAVLAGTAVEVDALLLRFLDSHEAWDLIDPVAECLDRASLTTSFWQEVKRAFGYGAEAPSLRDFALKLFRGANPLDSQVGLHAHGKVFLKRWKDSQAGRGSFRKWSGQFERDLQVAHALGSLDEWKPLGDNDTFEIFEKYTLRQLCLAFAKGEKAATLRGVLQQRRESFWWAEHKHGYAALENAVELRELLASTELTVESLAAGVHRYALSWWKIDAAYRRCTWNLRQYGQTQLMEQISQWVEKAYGNNFLLPLADRWSDQVRRQSAWDCPDVPAQRKFFSHYVRPFLARDQKVFVILSDALRYEAAMEFAQRLCSANRWSAAVEPLFGSLPSYTQLGMASCLPGQQLAVDAADSTVTVDGRSATGTANRADILRQECGGRGICLQAELFLELNTKTDGRVLMKDHDVIYILHNVIDKVGDAPGTEAKTFDAVEQTFEELDRIIRKIANINGSNMLLTADHGFLFQQDAGSLDATSPLPEAEAWTFRNRRFCLGRGIVQSPAVKVFESAALGLQGDWTAAFPLALSRFPLQGSGMRYVHGGFSLQEIVIPVVTINKSRTDDVGRVEVELLRVPPKITTGQFSIALFQEEPAVHKMLPRTLRIGVFAKDGTVLSDIRTQVFDSREPEARQRETTLLLVLSNAADAHNNSEVELRLEETVVGTDQIVTYKSHTLKLQKPFTSDFDEH